MKTPRYEVSAVVVLTLCIGWAAPAAAAAPDHLKCYKVRDRQARVTYTADLGGLVAEPGCMIKVPADMACVPATKTNVSRRPLPAGAVSAGQQVQLLQGQVPADSRPAAGIERPVRYAHRRRERLRVSSAPRTWGRPMAAFRQRDRRRASAAVGTISCTGTGQDGALRKGAPLDYQDNGDGTVTDTNTGLVWEKLSMDASVHNVANTYTFDNAIAGHVATLNSMNFAGHNDWRTPNVKELESIVNYQNVSPSVSSAFNNNCSPGCGVTTCSCTATLKYWTSTTVASAPPSGWFVNFDFGYTGFENKSMGFSVRAVRGG